LEELEKIVLPLFADIENKNVTRLMLDYERHAWQAEQLKRQVSIVPVADTHSLKIIFRTPDVSLQYRTAVSIFQTVIIKINLILLTKNQPNNTPNRSLISLLMQQHKQFPNPHSISENAPFLGGHPT